MPLPKLGPHCAQTRGKAWTSHLGRRTLCSALNEKRSGVLVGSSYLVLCALGGRLSVSFWCSRCWGFLFSGLLRLRVAFFGFRLGGLPFCRLCCWCCGVGSPFWASSAAPPPGCFLGCFRPWAGPILVLGVLAPPLCGPSSLLPGPACPPPVPPLGSGWLLGCPSGPFCWVSVPCRLALGLRTCLPLSFAAGVALLVCVVVLDPLACCGSSYSPPGEDRVCRGLCRSRAAGHLNKTDWVVIYLTC